MVLLIPNNSKFVFSLFSLVNLARDLSTLLIFAKNQLLISLIFFSLFLISVLLLSAQIFIISFPLVNLDLIFFFFFCFPREKLG